MKRQKYIKNMIKIIIILILVSFLGQNVYAENETGETPESGNNQTENTGDTNTSENTENSGSNSSTGESSTSTPTTPSSSNSGSGSSSGSSTPRRTTTTTKSSDATLSNLGIRPNDFSGFKPGTTTYNVTVPADVEEVEVYATATNSRATISGTGTKKLQEGNNALSVVVTAEDGTQKTYTINVTRSAEGENTENVPAEANGQGLASLTIENLELSPSFDTNTYTYTVKYIGEAESLNIQTTTTDPYYNVEIAGNEGLVEGENVITILVTDPDDNNIATYQITVNKSLVDEEALAREQEELERQQQQRRMIIIGVVVAIVIIIAIILIIRHRRNKEWAEDYTMPYGGLDDDDYNDEYNYDDNYNMNFNNGNITFDDDEEIQEVEPLEEVNQLEAEDILNKNTENHDQEKTPEELEKERIRQQFLSNYENEGLGFDDDDSNYESRKRRHKGKRFK